MENDESVDEAIVKAVAVEGGTMLMMVENGN